MSLSNPFKTGRSGREQSEEHRSDEHRKEMANAERKLEAAKTEQRLIIKALVAEKKERQNAIAGRRTRSGRVRFPSAEVRVHRRRDRNA
jgi:hypothetical protein